MSDFDEHDDFDDSGASRDEDDFFADDDEEIEYVSKSELKRDAQACFRLGEKLCKLSADVRETLNLGDEVEKSIALANKIKAHGGKKRQLKHLAKLLRQLDWNAIEEKLAQFDAIQRIEIQKFHDIESWRDRLLKGNEEDVNAFLDAFPQADRQPLRQAVRLAKKELEKPEQKKYQRQLFQWLRSIIEAE